MPHIVKNLLTVQPLPPTIYSPYRRLDVLVCVQSTLRVTTPLVLLDGHTWLVLELSHGGMGSPFDGCCRWYYGL